MRLPAAWKALVTSWVLVCMAGCSQHPAELARKITGSDTVIATNLFGSSSSYSGPEAAQLVRAIRHAKLDGQQDQDVNSAPVSSLRFMRGTNLLAEVFFDGPLLFAREGRFVDRTGALQRAWEDIEKAPPRRNP